MQRVRRNTEIVQNDEQAVLNARPPRPLAQMTARGGLHRRIEHCDFSGAARKRRENSTSSMSGIFAKPPSFINTSRRTKID